MTEPIFLNDGTGLLGKGGCRRPLTAGEMGKIAYPPRHGKIITIRYAGVFLFRTLRALNRLKPIMKRASPEEGP